MLTADATIEQTRRDLASAQRLGATGFPTVLFRDGEDLGIVTQGFDPQGTGADLEARLTTSVSR